MNINGRNVTKVERDLRIKERLRKETEFNGPIDERNVSRPLFEAGRNAYFDEYYFGIKLENQEIGKIGKFTNPSETYNFKRGYKYGEEKVSAVEKTGIVESLPEKYRDIAMQNKNKMTR